MNQTYQLRGYIVRPRGVSVIRTTAERALKILGIDSSTPDLGTFLETLMEFGITLDIVDDANFVLGGVEAVCIPETATIYLSDSTYRKAIANDPRTRFTIFHELGHLVLQHSKILHRADLSNVKPYEDSEWQADQFAAEATMPLSIIQDKKIGTVAEIQREFKVSEPAAKRRYNQLKQRGEMF